LIATIDFETTGLKAGEDEVLQVSIIDETIMSCLMFIVDRTIKAVGRMHRRYTALLHLW